MRIQLRFNQPISLQLPGGEGGWHTSVVLNHTENRELVVALPAALAEGSPLEAHSPVAVELALPDGLRRFTVQVMSVGDTPPSLRLSWPDEGERIQRREAVRVPTEMPARVQQVLAGGALAEAVVGVTSDISAGGMRLNLPHLLEPDIPVLITVQAPGIGPLACPARVLRGGELTSSTGANRYWVATIFADPPAEMLREINKLVLEVQRAMMRRSLI